VVKVVTDRQGEALYYSRAPIPHQRDRHEPSDSLGLHWIHLGIYIFRRETLARFADLPTGVLEDTEKLEQLRALEHGIPIRVWETTRPSLRVDTVKDLERAAAVLMNGPQRYDDSYAARPIS
jgi:3-deoxy-manno-octulosonate cytidylyltransferase (CMP-KDO synthetase)